MTTQIKIYYGNADKMKKTGKKWKTKKCGRCGEAHSGYSGKLDSNGIEYVICEKTNKRMNISGVGLEGFTFVYPTEWTRELVINLDFLGDRKLSEITAESLGIGRKEE